MRKIEVQLVGDYHAPATVSLRIARLAFLDAMESGGDLVTDDLAVLSQSQLAAFAIEFEDLARKLRTMAREKA